MSQEALIEPLFQGEQKSIRSTSCGRFAILALLMGLGSALLMTRSVGDRVISTWTSPPSMAYTSWSSRGTVVPYNDFDTGMHHYGAGRYGHSSRYHPSDYPSSRYNDYRHEDYAYRSGARHFDYGHHSAYGDEVAYGENGEPHVAAYRYQPGRSLDIPVGDYRGDYYSRHRGGYNDWHGGDYYDSHRRGYNDRYGGRYQHSYDDWHHSAGRYGYR